MNYYFKKEIKFVKVVINLAKHALLDILKRVVLHAFNLITLLKKLLNV